MANEEAGIPQEGSRVTFSKPSWKREFAMAMARAVGLCRFALTKMNHTLLVALAFVYFSVIGYLHDFAYYNWIHNIEILKYTNAEDFAFSVLKHPLMVLVAAVAIPLSLAIMVVVETFGRMFHGYLNFLNDRKRREFSPLSTPEITIRARRAPSGTSTEAGEHDGGRARRMSAHDLGRYTEFIANFLKLRGSFLVRYMLAGIGQAVYRLYRFSVKVGAFVAPAIAAIGLFLAVVTPLAIQVLVPISSACQTAKETQMGRLQLRWPNKMIYDAEHLGTSSEFAFFRTSLAMDEEGQGSTNKNGRGLASDVAKTNGSASDFGCISEMMGYLAVAMENESPGSASEEGQGSVLVVPKTNVSAFDIGCSREVTNGEPVEVGCSPRVSDKEEDETAAEVFEPAIEKLSKVLDDHAQKTGEQVRQLSEVDPFWWTP